LIGIRFDGEPRPTNKNLTPDAIGHRSFLLSFRFFYIAISEHGIIAPALLKRIHDPNVLGR
jgi:hypothetical protein